MNAARVHTTGEWAPVNVKPNAIVLFGARYGYHDPRDADLLPNGRLKNATIDLHLHCRPVQPLVIGLGGYRRLATTYSSGTLTNDYWNLALGFEF